MSKLSSGTLSKRWQKRFFRLEGHYFKYYENEESDQKDVKGVVDLKDVSAVEQQGVEVVVKFKNATAEQKVPYFFLGINFTNRTFSVQGRC